MDKRKFPSEDHVYFGENKLYSYNFFDSGFRNTSFKTLTNISVAQ